MNLKVQYYTDEFTEAQILAGNANTLPVGVQLRASDTGTKFDTQAGDIIPIASGEAGGGSYEKVQFFTGANNLTPSSTGKTKIFHLEGGTLNALSTANWPIPTSPQKFEIQNHTGANATFSITTGQGQFSGLVDFDGDVVEDSSFSIPKNSMISVTVDEDGWVQVSPVMASYSKGEVDTALAGKVNTADIINNLTTTDINKPLSAAQGKSLQDNKSASTHTHSDATSSVSGLMSGPDKTKLNGVATSATANDTDANLKNRANHTGSQAQSTITNLTTDLAAKASSTHSHSQSDVTNLTTDLAAKQATLVSGTSIKTLNSNNLLGSGNITLAADLPGGTAQIATNEGIDKGNAVESADGLFTVLQYKTVGSSTFKVPLNVAQVHVLVVGGGGAGGTNHGGGGGAGGFVENSSLIVTPGASHSITVGDGGVSSANADVGSTNGGNSAFGTTYTAVGGGRGGQRSSSGATSFSPLAGGSGGGGAGNNPIGGAQLTGATSNQTDYGTFDHGSSGGNGSTDATAGNGGGGGGANASGTNASGASGGTAGNGGAGINSSITGAAVGYAGGGGGGEWGAAGGQYDGGSATHGGGRGEDWNTNAAEAGGINTGGGGGGGGANTGRGGAGGSGIIVVRFATQTRTYTGLLSFADDTAAKAASLLVGQFYRNSTTGAVTQVQ
ncbi:MAG TPA: hypothetical protein VIH42_08260 [Thermoguttaceae bacterium]